MRSPWCTAPSRSSGAATSTSSGKATNRWSSLAILVTFIAGPFAKGAAAQASWERVWTNSATQLQPPNRRSHGMQFANGSMYVYGGVGSISGLNDLWSFDLDGQRQWASIGQAPGTGLSAIPEARAGMWARD